MAVTVLGVGGVECFQELDGSRTRQKWIVDWTSDIFACITVATLLVMYAHGVQTVQLHGR